MEKEKKTRKLSGTRCLAISIIFVVLLYGCFILVNLVEEVIELTNVGLCYGDTYDKEQDGESTNDSVCQEKCDKQDYIDTVLNLLGIVVTVWLGLNVYNIIARDKVEELSYETDILMTEQKNVQTSLKYARKFWNDEYLCIRSALLLKISEQGQLLFSPFLKKEIEKRYTYQCAKCSEAEIVDRIKVLHWLLNVEQIYSLAYFAYENGKSADLCSYHRLISNVEIKDIEKNINKVERDFYLGYLAFRKADIMWFRGYIKGKTEEQYETWRKICKYLCECEEKWIGINGQIDDDIDDETRLMIIYINNLRAEYYRACVLSNTSYSANVEDQNCVKKWFDVSFSMFSEHMKTKYKAAFSQIARNYGAFFDNLGVADAFNQMKRFEEAEKKYIDALSGGHFAKNYHVLVSLKLKQAENSIKQNLKQADQYIEEAERYFELYNMCENRDIMYTLAFKLLILNLKNKDGNLDEQRRICSLIKFCKERGSISLSENMQRKIDEISQKIEEKLV